MKDERWLNIALTLINNVPAVAAGFLSATLRCGTAKGFAMGLSDWTDLDVLSRKIADGEERLERARVTQNHGLVKLLEKQLAAAETLRDRMLSQIATYLTSSRTSTEQHPASLPEISAAPPQPIATEEPSKGIDTMWNQLSRADLERTKRDLDARRSEMLARHAEELKALEADKAEIDILEQAIDAIARKFNIGSAEVVSLGRATVSQAG